MSDACETKAYYTIPNIAPTSSGSIHVVPRQVLERIVQGDIQIIMNNESLQPVLSTIVSEWMKYVDSLKHLATGPWQSMDDAPKDGTAVLLRFKNGFCQVCYWAEWEVGGESPQVYGGQTVIQGSPPDGLESGWIVNGDDVCVIMDEPIAWARLTEEK